MCGSCTNCWFNASGSRCTFHGKFISTIKCYQPFTNRFHGSAQ
jgi:hypothetical protein